MVREAHVFQCWCGPWHMVLAAFPDKVTSSEHLESGGRNADFSSPLKRHLSISRAEIHLGIVCHAWLCCDLAAQGPCAQPLFLPLHYL